MIPVITKWLSIGFSTAAAVDQTQTEFSPLHLRPPPRLLSWLLCSMDGWRTIQIIIHAKNVSLSIEYAKQDFRSKSYYMSCIAYAVSLSKCGWWNLGSNLLIYKIKFPYLCLVHKSPFLGMSLKYPNIAWWSKKRLFKWAALEGSIRWMDEELFKL